MKNLLKKIWHRIGLLNYRRNYYFAKLLHPKVPLKPIRYLPNGFAVNKIGNTGIRVVDNFCTEDEASYLIEKARRAMQKSGVIQDGKVVLDKGRTSSHSVVFHRFHQDPEILPIIARGAMLVGVPMDNAEQIYVSRYSAGEFYHGHYDLSNSFMSADRLCTVLLYLNTLDEAEGGATYFRDLNVAVQPRQGRAVIWPNVQADGSARRDTLHAALPVESADTEKWVIQLWFRPYRMHKLHRKLTAGHTSPGEPLRAGDTPPTGAWIAEGDR